VQVGVEAVAVQPGHRSVLGEVAGPDVEQPAVGERPAREHVAGELVRAARHQRVVDDLGLGLEQQVGALQVQLAGEPAVRGCLLGARGILGLGADRGVRAEPRLDVDRAAVTVLHRRGDRVVHEARGVDLEACCDVLERRAICLAEQRQAAVALGVDRMLGEPEPEHWHEPAGANVHPVRRARVLPPHEVVLARPQRVEHAAAVLWTAQAARHVDGEAPRARRCVDLGLHRVGSCG